MPKASYRLGAKHEAVTYGYATTIVRRLDHPELHELIGSTSPALNEVYVTSSHNVEASLRNEIVFIRRGEGSPAGRGGAVHIYAHPSVRVSVIDGVMEDQRG